MEIKDLICLLDAKKRSKYVRFIADKGKNSCEKCLKYHNQIFASDDHQKPILPIHPNCRCKYIDIEEMDPCDIDESIATPKKSKILSPADEKEIILNIAKDEYLRQSKINYNPIDACGTQADELASMLYRYNFKHWKFYIIMGSKYFITVRYAINAFRGQTQHHVVLVEYKIDVKKSFILDTYGKGDISGNTSYIKWRTK